MGLFVNRLSGLTQVNGATSSVKFNPQNFVKSTFDFKANLNAPEQRDLANARLLGDDVKGAAVYLLA